MQRLVLAFASCALLTACAERPFVEHLAQDDAALAQSYVQKEEPIITRTGRGEVCFSQAQSMEQVQHAAQNTCSEYGLQAIIDGIERYQCRLTNPHVAHFRCVDPAMTTEQGEYVNVFDRKAVVAWEKRTGQKAPLRQTAGAYMSWPDRGGPERGGANQSLTTPHGNQGTSDPIPLAPPQSDIPSSVPPIATQPSPSSIAPPNLPPVSPTPRQPAIESFTVTPGSWSDHF